MARLNPLDGVPLERRRGSGSAACYRLEGRGLAPWTLNLQKPQLAASG